MELSIIIPAFNEAHRIGRTLEHITEFCRTSGHTIEIIVVDDGSTDQTATVVTQQQLPNVKLITQPVNAGKFAAFKTGVQQAQHEWILLYDADGSTPIAVLEQFIPLTKQYDCLIGSRRALDANITVPQPIFRTVLGRLSYYTIRLATGIRLKDTQCGFKLCRTAIAKRAVHKMIIDRFAGDVEFIYLAILFGARTKEVPVEWHDMPDSKVRLKDYLHSLRDVLKIRRAIKQGEYR